MSPAEAATEARRLRKAAQDPLLTLSEAMDLTRQAQAAQAMADCGSHPAGDRSEE